MTQLPHIITEAEKQNFLKSRKKRNLAIALGLGFFIIILYCTTIFKLGSQLFL